MSLKAKAELLLSLHQAGNPVVVPTIWDAWSAQVAADLGFAALTIGSHPVASSLGREDNEGLSLEEMLTQVAVIAGAVNVPVSADMESGYGAEPEILVEGLLAAGAVGLNLEDTVHSEGGRLRTTAEHAAYIRAVREAADQRDVHVVINARTDILLHQIGPAEDRLDRAIERLAAAAQAGADALYPVGMHDDATWRRLTSELPLPLNALARPDQDDLTQLRELGIGRISFGPRLQSAAADLIRPLLTPWVP